MGERKELVTRDDLRRALVVNALTKPVNVLVPAAVVVAGLLLGTVWLLVVAVVAYAGLAALTFFDDAEAERVGARAYGGSKGRGLGESTARVDPRELAQPVAMRLESALRAEAAIRQAIADSGLPLTDVATEVDALVTAMERIARRADRVHGYLETQDQGALERRIAQLRAEGAGGDADARSQTVAALEQQVAANAELRDQLGRFFDEMEHLTASLGAINAQIVAMGISTEAAEQTELAGQVRGLRESVDAIAAGLKTAYAETDGTA